MKKVVVGREREVIVLFYFTLMMSHLVRRPGASSIRCIVAGVDPEEILKDDQKTGAYKQKGD